MTAIIDTLRLMTRGAYALQKLRIQAGLRLCANFREKLKEDIGDTQEDEELGEKALEIIVDLKRRYRLLTQGVAKNRTLPKREGFVGDGVVDDVTELALIAEYADLESAEAACFRHIGDALEQVPFFRAWLKAQVGIGPAMAAVLLTSFDVHRAVRPSQFNAVAGLDVGPDNRARARWESHLVERKYTAKDGSTKTRMGTTFDPWLQSKMLGALAPSLMRSGSPYRKYYDNYKHRILTDPARIKDKVKKGMTLEERQAIWPPLRIHRASQRYMVKMLLQDFWREWRAFEGLPIVPSYHEAILGHQHHGNEAAE
jgi:hypothetical protein